MKMHALRDGAVAVALLTLAAGCGRDRKGEEAGGAAGTPESGGVAVVAEGADMNIPIAILANAQLDGDLAADVMNRGLLRGVWEDGKLVDKTAAESPMALARSYEYLGPDSTAVRFHMRSDARWSDGQPLTAHDIVFTYGLVKDPAVAAEQQSYVARLVP